MVEIDTNKNNNTNNTNMKNQNVFQQSIPYAVSADSIAIPVQVPTVAPQTYEYQRPLRSIVYAQLIFLIFSFLVLYHMWWFIVSGIVLIFIGFIGAQDPVDHLRIKWVKAYWIGNVIMIVYVIVSAIFFLIWLIAEDTKSDWLWFVLIFGILNYFLLGALFCIGMKRGKEYARELERNPPRRIIAQPFGMATTTNLS